MEIIFIRHGQSSNNALTDPSQRVQDPLLTPTGEQQARRVADYIAGGEHLVGGNHAEAKDARPPLDRLYCSAMVRAMQTAEPIGKALGLNPEVWIDIHEFGGIFLERPDGGSDGFPGQKRGEVETRFPAYVLPPALGEDGWWSGPRESLEAKQERVERSAAALWQRAESNERIGLVTHGDYMSALLKVLLGVKDRADLYLDHRNTALTRLHLYADGSSYLFYNNRFGHLESDLVT
jgi:2,3-bisphosphoglycerate-dependent phosphoglycerate mutase